MGNNASEGAARIIVTGGTFDKRYDAIKGELTFTETHLPALLEQARVGLSLALEIRLLIDSLQMTEAHRQEVLEACRASPSARSSSCTEPTRWFRPRRWRPRRADKTVVFLARWCHTGAGSDAPFNLGFRSPPRRRAPSGVYVAMNARIFPWTTSRRTARRGLKRR
jgi:L-asparaginase